MGFKLSQLEEGASVTLLLSNAENSMQLGATIKKHLKDNIALITLNYETTKKLVFDNVQVDMEYYQDNDVPIIWHGVKIGYFKGEYLLQAPVDGVRHNRRGYFRVGVTVPTRIQAAGKSAQVMIRDISLSGFSLADRTKELHLNKGDRLSIRLDDLGFSLNLTGKIIRIEEREDIIIYGLEICNVCKDLSAYINIKQRRKQ